MTFVKRIAGATTLAAATLIGYGLFPPPAHAGYIVTLTQQGPNVVATGSGTLDLAGLTFEGNFSSNGATITPDDNVGLIETGPTTPQPASLYTGFTGPSSFGPPTGGGHRARSGSGETVAIAGGQDKTLYVPQGYVFGSPLSDTATFADLSLISVTIPGPYLWTWGSGATADSFELQIGAGPAVPEPASLTLLGVALTGLGVVRRRTRNQPRGSF